MARSRTIKPELFIDGGLSECSRDARLLFIGLLPFVDDMGRRRYSARELKNEVFPADDDVDAQNVGIWFHQLVKAGIVELYDVHTPRGNTQYFRLPNFLRHQRISHPSHSVTPKSPSENGSAQCLCDKCQNERENEPNNRPALPGATQNAPESSGTRETRRVRESQGEREEDQTHSANGHNQNVTPRANQLVNPETSVENRRAERRILGEISMRILVLLAIEPSPLLLQTVTESIAVKARSMGYSHEAAAEQIAARAAYLAGQSPPEDWIAWFFDARYQFISQGDERLRDRRVEARPVCGGSRCEDGWERVLVNGGAVLRRCPDCVQLWRDMGM